MAICAVCKLDDGLVINKIIAEVSDVPPADCQLVEIPDGDPCDFGWSWNGSQFVPPTTN